MNSMDFQRKIYPKLLHISKILLFELRLISFRSTSKELNQLSDALRYAFYKNFTDDEMQWINKIEEIRTNLNKSKEKIAKIDFGSGNPYQTRIEKPLEDGVKIYSTVGKISKNSSKPMSWAMVLFSLIRNTKPISCIELGTSVGISASYQSAALELNGTGYLTTLEGDKNIARIAESTFKKLNLNNVNIRTGKFEDTLEETLTDHQPIDYVFVDGHHDEKATIQYFNQILNYANRDSILVFDDINWSKGMQSAWTSIYQDPRVKISVDLGAIGICMLNSSAKKKHLILPF
ncbi:MAG: class I SAM-dependent methyltransferase [Candidatus Marinimicrobia bacterium]|nr:class I SAM-dependent methyltransferase [Candidatus Neomarinimicrobiota bacterium]